MKSPSKKYSTFAVAALLAIGGSDFNCARDFALEKFVDTVGGELALQNLSKISYEANGVTDALNEGLLPGDLDTTELVLSPFTLSAKQDLETRSIRLAYQDRSFQLAGPIPPVTEIIQGDIGVFEGNSLFGFPLGAMTSDHVASSVKQQRLLFPHLLLKKALETPSIVIDFGTKRINNTLYHFLVLEDEVFPITLFLDPVSGRLARAETRESDPLLRDTKLEILYDDWRLTGNDLFFPFDITIRLNGFTVRNEIRSTIEINQNFAENTFEFPAGIAPIFDAELAERGKRASQFHQMFSFLGFPDGFLTQVVPIQLSPGVFHLTGIVHHSLAIEQENGIVIVEAPVYPERSEAIIAWAQQQFPGKSITDVISTHHHMDHSAGLRTFVAQGSNIILGALSENFFRNEVFANNSEILPDFLSLHPGNAPNITVVPQNGSILLDDPIRPVTAIHIPSVHADDMVIAYLSNQELLFNSDLFSPGLPFFSEEAISLADDLNQAINDLGISISGLVGGHGFGVSTLDDFRNSFGF